VGSVLFECTLVTLGISTPSVTHSICTEKCKASYSFDIDECRLQYGDAVADAEDLNNCIQEARGDYRSCLDDCVRISGILPKSFSNLARKIGVRMC
jgi:hypothetical protein